MLSYACEWSESFDNDGYNDSVVVHYSLHDTLEEAQDYAQKGYQAYGLLTGEATKETMDDYWKPIFCDVIFVYENAQLHGLYSNMQDGWRFYPVKDHWKELYADLINFPPSVPNQRYNI